MSKTESNDTDDGRQASRRDRHNQRAYRDFAPGERVETKELNHVDKNVRRENERVWAHYRATDATQTEAADRATSLVEMSQATASRVSRQMEREILTGDKIRALEGRTPEGVEALEATGDSGEDVLDAYRRVISNAIADLDALREITNPHRPTPEWARKRFPNLDPDVGKAYGRQSPLYEEWHIHD